MKITVNRVDENSVYGYLEGCYTRDEAQRCCAMHISRWPPRSQTDYTARAHVVYLDLIGCRSVQRGGMCRHVGRRLFQTGGVDVHSGTQGERKTRVVSRTAPADSIGIRGAQDHAGGISEVLSR